MPTGKNITPTPDAGWPSSFTVPLTGTSQPVDPRSCRRSRSRRGSTPHNSEAEPRKTACYFLPGKISRSRSSRRTGNITPTANSELFVASLPDMRRDLRQHGQIGGLRENRTEASPNVTLMPPGCRLPGVPNSASRPTILSRLPVYHAPRNTSKRLMPYQLQVEAELHPAAIAPSRWERHRSHCAFARQGPRCSRSRR